LEERRKAALEIYEREPVPTWRRSGFWTTTLRNLRLDELEPRHYDAVDSFDDIPAVAHDALASDELSGLIVQRGASVVYSSLDPSVGGQGVIFTSLERGVEEHPELVEQWYMKRLSEEEGKFPAASAAFWTGGAFLHVPKNLQIEKPFQVVYVIDEPGTAQYAHTLGVVGEFSECYLREYCLAPDFEGQALHAGGFELYCQTGSQVRLAPFQDWGSGEVYD